MNAISSVKSAAALPREPFDRARDSVNAWRGRCLDAFTRAEAAVTETLTLLSEVHGRGAGVKLPHLTGQKFDAFAAAIGLDGAFAVEGKAVVPALSSFRTHEQLRTMLCHGVISITLDPKGRWTMVLRVIALRSRKRSVEVRVIEEDEAICMGSEIVRASKRLCDQLRNLRADFENQRVI